MKRRNFIKLSGAASVGAVVLPSIDIRANEWLYKMACNGISERIIVLIQLNGGNDGLNTIIPIEQYDEYANFRPTTKVPETGANKYIELDNTLSLSDQVGLHPIMTGVKDMYDSGNVAIVQGVGYPLQNRSHFKSMDLWMTGGDGEAQNFNFYNGWVGRYLEATNDLSNPTNHPLAIEVGSRNISAAMHTPSGEHVSINLTNVDPAGYYTVMNEIGNPTLGQACLPNSDHGDMIRFIQGVEESASVYAGGITDAFNAGSNAISYPNLDLADQLKTVARLISGGCTTKVYQVVLGGFDTHDAQVEAGGDPNLGRHAVLLDELSQSVKAFFDDLKAQNLDERVVGTTFSEFGRKVKENGNLGTDHGGIAPMMLFGTPIKGGMYGTNVDLSEADQLNNYQLNTVQHDYRSVLTTIVQDFLGADNTATDTTFYDYQNSQGFLNDKIPSLIGSGYIVDPSCYGVLTAPEFDNTLFNLFPNPASFQTTLNFREYFIGDIVLTDMHGRVLQQNKIDTLSSELQLDVSELAAGNYIISLDGNYKGATKLLVQR